MRSSEYANASYPHQVPVRPGTDSYPVIARLVGLDGEETWASATVVRHAPGHVMCRIPITPTSPNSSSYVRPEATYVWLVNDDVQGARNP